MPSATRKPDTWTQSLNQRKAQYEERITTYRKTLALAYGVVSIFLSNIYNDDSRLIMNFMGLRAVAYRLRPVSGILKASFM